VGDSWLVSEGLKPGDRVIVEGIQRARPGTPVKAVPFGAAPAAAGQQPAKPQQPAASPAQQPAAAQQTAPATK
jgi:membrane fusion protein (multidrug efflux system)